MKTKAHSIYIDDSHSLAIFAEFEDYARIWRVGSPYVGGKRFLGFGSGGGRLSIATAADAIMVGNYRERRVSAIAIAGGQVMWRVSVDAPVMSVNCLVGGRAVCVSLENGCCMMLDVDTGAALSNEARVSSVYGGGESGFLLMCRNKAYEIRSRLGSWMLTMRGHSSMARHLGEKFIVLAELTDRGSCVRLVGIEERSEVWSHIGAVGSVPMAVGVLGESVVVLEKQTSNATCRVVVLGMHDGCLSGSVEIPYSRASVYLPSGHFLLDAGQVINALSGVIEYVVEERDA